MMRLLVVAMAVVAALLAVGAHAQSQPTTGVFNIGSKKQPNVNFHPYHVEVTYPTCPGGLCPETFDDGKGYPVVLFVTGFSGRIDAASYSSLTSGIAERGVVVVTVDQEFGVTVTLNYSRLGDQLQRVIGYIQNTDVDNYAKPSLLRDLRGKSDFGSGSLRENGRRLFFMGHSSGAHVALQNIKDNALRTESCDYVGGVIMLSPMDGQDPLGFGGGFVVEKDKLLPFLTPGIIIAGSLDRADSETIIGAPCTPDDRGNKHFYNGWGGLVYYLEAVNAGTLDILEVTASSGYEQYCAATPETDLRGKYQKMVRNAINAFIAGVALNKDNELKKVADLSYLDYGSSISTEAGVIIETKGTGRTFSCAFLPAEQGLSFEVQLGLILFVVFFVLTFIGGICYFFRRMDGDTLHKYHIAEGVGFDHPTSFQAKLEPEYGVHSTQVYNEFNPSQSLNLDNTRTPSINI